MKERRKRCSSAPLTFLCSVVSLRLTKSAKNSQASPHLRQFSAPLCRLYLFSLAGCYSNVVGNCCEVECKPAANVAIC